MGRLYEAYSGGKESPLEELSVQYGDYAVWQRGWFESGVLERQLSYWKEKLGGELPLLQLPTDRPRPPVQTYQGASRYLSIDQNLKSSLKALSRQENVTLFMTLLAAFKSLLHRYSGQDDIIIGSPIAN